MYTNMWHQRHLELRLGKGLEIKKHTEPWVTLETRMPILLCSRAAYIGLFLTDGHTLALGIYFQPQAD